MFDCLTTKNGFAELSVEETQELDGGLLAEIIAGAIGAVIYLVANEVCEDFTGKTIGKAVADKFWPAK